MTKNIDPKELKKLLIQRAKNKSKLANQRKARHKDREETKEILKWIAEEKMYNPFYHWFKQIDKAMRFALEQKSKEKAAIND